MGPLRKMACLLHPTDPGSVLSKSGQACQHIARECAVDRLAWRSKRANEVLKRSQTEACLEDWSKRQVRSCQRHSSLLRGVSSLEGLGAIPLCSAVSPGHHDNTSLGEAPLFTWIPPMRRICGRIWGSLASKAKKRNRTTKSLRHAWEKRHRPLAHDKQPNLPRTEPGQSLHQESACQKAGFCVCVWAWRVTIHKAPTSLGQSYPMCSAEKGRCRYAFPSLFPSRPKTQQQHERPKAQNNVPMPQMSSLLGDCLFVIQFLGCLWICRQGKGQKPGRSHVFPRVIFQSSEGGGSPPRPQGLG